MSDFYNKSELSYVKLQDFYIEKPTHTLIVIGNGFDKMHGVPLGYFDFRDSMRKGNKLRENLEFLIDSDTRDMQEVVANIKIPEKLEKLYNFKEYNRES